MSKGIRKDLGLAVAVLIGLSGLSQASDAAQGRTAGTFDVSPTGAATYTIPIWASPGPQGVQPTLALTYNSQQGIGPIGVGWSLNGLSGISRCNLTFAQDSTPAPVALATADGYCLDGQRLRLTSGTYGTAGSTYQTEIANFANVTAVGTAGNGPASFLVQRKDGRTYEYGNGGNSQVLADGTTASLWMLDKVTDRAGNTMKLTYMAPSSTLAGTTVPTTISWTPTASGSSTYSYTMTFAYGANVPQSSYYGYKAGTPVLNTNLLSSITIAYSGTTVKKYFLSYHLSPTTGADELTQVQECADSAGTNCLLPTAITYQSGAPGVSTTGTQVTSVSSTASPVYSHYDLNGDGYPDLIFVNGTTWYVAFGSATGYGTPKNTGILATSSMVPGDLLGTGKDGLLANNGGTWFYYTWNGSAFTGASTGLAYDTNSSQWLLADINGDGLPDLIKMTGTQTQVFTWLNTSSGTTISFASAVDAYDLNLNGLVQATLFSGSDGQLAFGTLRSIDFNGDGRKDLLLIEEKKLAGGAITVTSYALVSNGSTFTAVELGAVNAGNPSNVALVDINSDGCTDFIGSTSTDAILYISGCNGAAPSTVDLGAIQILGAMDWNGDGRADLLVPNTGETVGVYLSTGTGFSSLVSTAVPMIDSSGNPYNFFAFDPNGDGLSDLGYQTSRTGAIGYFPHNGAGTPPDLLSSVSDGYGNSASPSYVSIAQSDYTSGTDATYPYQNYMGPMYVVNRVTFSDPSNAPSGTYYQTYSYADAWTNLQGRGFSAFEKVQRYDSRSALWETLYNDVKFPWTGILDADKVSQDQAGNTVVQFSWIDRLSTTLDSTANNERYFVYNDSAVVQSYEVGGSENGQLIGTSRTTYVFDNWGNPTTVTQVLTDNDSSSPYLNDTWTTTTTNTPDVDTTHWCLNRLTETQVAYAASNGSTSVTRTKTFTPDTTNCRYTQVVTEPSSSTYKVTEAFGYDSFGNINTDTITGVGMTAREAQLNWGTTGQFPASVTDPSGAQTQYAYNFSFGLPASQTDPNSTSTNPIVTDWTYDAFGRPATETQSDGTSMSWSYNACGSSCVNANNETTVVMTLLNKSGGTIRTMNTYLDKLDRTLVTSATMLSGSFDRNEVQYDSLGRVAKRAFPCQMGCTPSYKTYAYDALNRLVEAERPINAASGVASCNPTTVPPATGCQGFSVNYQGQTIVRTDALGNATTLIHDVNGWLREAKDATGYAVTLAYDAAGSTTGIRDSQSNTLLAATYAYGLKPFKLTATDADLGAWTYTYDALGELTGWKDARGQSFAMTYDALSRPLTRSEPDLFTQWTWGSSAASDNLGKLQSVCTGTGTNPTNCTAAPGYSESETYDTLGRPSQRTISIPGDTTYTYTSTYDSTTGLPSTLTYPTGAGYALALKYAYANGILQSITDTSDSPNVTLWTANTMNPAGQITEETFGNGVVVNHTFDAITHWLNSVTAGTGSSTTIQNNAYLFDENGNVTQRQDNNAGVTENAFYDSLNRLTHTVGGTGTVLTYDALGRVATWATSEIATLTNTYTTEQSGCTYYSNSQLHAVRGNTQGSNSNAFCYDANGNMTAHNGGTADPITFSWMSYNQPNVMRRTADNSSSQFFYNHNHQRWKQVASYSGSSETTEYIGGLLENMTNSTGTFFRYYVPAGNNFIVYSHPSSGSNAIYYATRDQIGSTASITNASGTLLVQEKYAALGWNENSAAQEATMATISRHEFTGQEGIDNPGLSLVNMNGRIYQPSGMMFLSADPTVPNPANTQSYNRYGYVRSNPLTLVDPSGYQEQPTTKPVDCMDSSQCNAGQQSGAGTVINFPDFNDPDVSDPFYDDNLSSASLAGVHQAIGDQAAANQAAANQAAANQAVANQLQAEQSIAGESQEYESSPQGDQPASDITVTATRLPNPQPALFLGYPATFFAPAGTQFEALRQAGRDFAKNGGKIWQVGKFIGRSGIFNFQLISDDQGLGYAFYQEAANFAVGVFMEGFYDGSSIGYTEMTVSGQFIATGSSNWSPQQVVQWQQLWTAGWNAAQVGNYPVQVGTPWQMSFPVPGPSLPSVRFP